MDLELYDFFLFSFPLVVSVLYHESCFSKFNLIYLELSSFKYYFLALRKFGSARSISRATYLVSS